MVSFAASLAFAAVAMQSLMATASYEPFGIYNSSVTPSDLPWNTYNYCNAPHVNQAHYVVPPESSDAQLVYLNLLMRHHKRTPDNLYPDENALNPSAGWDCTDFLQFNFGGGPSARVHHETYTPSDHPFVSQIWNGTCDAGQLTRGGLEDAVKHGKDFWSVYNGKLGFLRHVDEREIYIRTSTETRTHQVAGGLLYGMDPKLLNQAFKIHTQPANIDSLVPRYACPAANSIRDAYQSVPAWTNHLETNLALQHRLDETLGTSGLSAWSSWYDHFFDTFTSRTCNGHSLPCNRTGSCVSQEDAARVHALGDWEYNYIWNTADNAAEYVRLSFGVLFGELVSNFNSFTAGKESIKARLYIGHDGTMIRLASGLGFGKRAPLRWPALGSEIVIEVWQTRLGSNFVRVMHEGVPVEGLQWLPLGKFVHLLEDQSPTDIATACSQT